MKKIISAILVILAVNLIGCASTGVLMAKPKVTIYGETYPAKNVDSPIDVFNTQRPDRPYIEIAEISCRDTEDSWNLEQILLKAREIGADAIIVTGRAGYYGVGVPVGNMSYLATEGYGIRAIAVKYR